ncbi:MAG: PQQ-binding-like beta-propeller repeat protein, partial [Pirellula sp.]
MKKNLVTSLAFGGLLFAAVSSVQADNWPQWRGPSNDGISTEKNIPTHWSKSEKIAWRTPLPGQAGATPCVWNDRVFLTSSDGDDLALLCIDTKDGKVL